MFQNFLMSGITPLQNMNEHHGWQNRPFVGIWPEDQELNESCITRTMQKKRNRISFSTEQLAKLQLEYQRNKYLDRKRRSELAFCLNLPEKTIKVWFQNRRMKERIQRSRALIKKNHSPTKPDQIINYPDSSQPRSDDPQPAGEVYNSGYNYIQSYQSSDEAYQLPESALHLQNANPAYNYVNSSCGDEIYPSDSSINSSINSSYCDNIYSSDCSTNLSYCGWPLSEVNTTGVNGTQCFDNTEVGFVHL